tara:strand:- start:274 stop:1689 length:1416 start_codon:yes stop_codon:yes gene_type:complete
MAYIGPEPNPGQNREVDDISSGFNGGTASFTLQVNGQNVSPGSSNAIIVSLGGVIQNPGTDYTVSASTITFTTNPASGLSFFGLVLGQSIDTEGTADGSITLAKFVNGTSSNNGKFLRANNGAAPSFETVSSVGGATGVDFNDNVKARFGDSNDLEIFHNTSNSVINDAGTGNLLLQLGGSTKLDVTSTGIVVTGTIGSDGIYMGDNEKALFGANDDLEIYHAGGDSKIEHTTSGTDLRLITSGGGDDILMQPADDFLVQVAGATKNAIIARNDGATELYWQGTSAGLRIETTQEGTVLTGAATGFSHIMRNTKTGTDLSGLNIDFGQGGGNNNQRHFLACTDQNATRALIDADGGMRNVNGSYGSISDVTLKENIVDAPSQWNDIKNIKIRNFNFKASSGHDTTKKIGVIAQELETVCPNLVESTYNDGVDTGKKAVKSSILYMKAIKALQEAMTKIETLQTKVAALEAA